MSAATLTAPHLAPPVPCLARTGLVHDHACTCLGARDGDLPRYP